MTNVRSPLYSSGGGRGEIKSIICHRRTVDNLLVPAVWKCQRLQGCMWDKPRHLFRISTLLGLWGLSTRMHHLRSHNYMVRCRDCSISPMRKLRATEDERIVQAYPARSECNKLFFSGRFLSFRRIKARSVQTPSFRIRTVRCPSGADTSLSAAARGSWRCP